MPDKELSSLLQTVTSGIQDYIETKSKESNSELLEEKQNQIGKSLASLIDAWLDNPAGAQSQFDAWERANHEAVDKETLNINYWLTQFIDTRMKAVKG